MSGSVQVRILNGDSSSGIVQECYACGDELSTHTKCRAKACFKQLREEYSKFNYIILPIIKKWWQW